MHNEENSFAVAAQMYGDVRQLKGTSKKMIFTARRDRCGPGHAKGLMDRLCEDRDFLRCPQEKYEIMKLTINRQ